MTFESFHFLRPWWLLGFLILPPLLWRLMRIAPSGGSWHQLCDPHLLPHLLVGSERDGGKGAWVLLGLGWGLGLLALAGPVWSKLPQPVVRAESGLVIVLDLSRSMDAQDLRPSRLTRAKHKVLDVLTRRTDGQTGLVVFAQEPFVVSPLTDDAKTIASLVSPLSTDIMPVQGSRPELALERADSLLTQGGMTEGTILLITDGAEGEAIEEKVVELREKGRTVSILGVGTEDGAPIPLAGGGFLKDNSGAIVIPKLNPSSLQALAQLGGGAFSTLQTDDSDLERILTPYQDPFSLKASGESERTTDLWREEGPWLVLALLAVSVPAFRKGWLGMVLLASVLCPPSAQAWNWEDLWSRPDQQGARLFQAGNYQEAAKRFEDERWKGVALYHAGQYEDAAQAFEQATDPDSLYNKGNALAKLGKYEEALAAYEQTLQQAPDHEDAKYNAELLKKFLEQQHHRSQGGDSNSQRKNQDSQGSQSQKDQPQKQGPSEGTTQHLDKGERNSKQTKQGDQGAPSPNDTEAQEENSLSVNKQDSEKDRLARNKNQQPLGGQKNQEEDLQKSQSSQLAKSAEESEGNLEERQAMEQWLRRIPDDPGGLLRRKFLLEHQRRGRTIQGVGQPW